MNNQFTREQAIVAFNQLAALIVGRRFAMQTEELRESPSLRIKKCRQLVSEEGDQALGDPIKSKQVIRKLESLNSLAIFAKIVDNM